MINAPEDELRFRISTEADIPGLLALWEAETPWGSLSEDTWRSWYVDTPHGPCIVPVGLRGQEIVAQLVLTPSVLTLFDNNTGLREVKALRLSAPVLRRDLRRKILRSTDHPVVSLLQTGVAQGKAQEYSVVYALPEHSWLPFFKWMNRDPKLPQFAIAEFGCVSAIDPSPLVLQDDSDNRYCVRREARFTEEYETLWDAAKTSHPVGITRDGAWLTYKHASNVVFSVRCPDSGELAGYAAVKPGSGLIVDFVARSPKVSIPVLAAVLRFILTGEPESLLPGFTGLKAMKTPAMAPVLEALGFTEAAYKFAFVCQSVSEAVAAEAIAPERWYILPGD